MVYVINILIFLIGVLKYLGILNINLKDRYGYEVSGLELISVSMFVIIFLGIIKFIDRKNINKYNKEELWLIKIEYAILLNLLD